MKLEDLLRMKVNINGKESSPDFRVAVQQIDFNPDGVHFLIHPMGHNGETLDFVCHGNNITQLSLRRHNDELRLP